jgi:UPF0716 protein FxsA|tara:strand:+ start:325 stop:765 length:441 start_codon:yes stop_codon:yes gene_type:complete
MPVAEMWLLITVGSQIGALPTIGLVLLTAVVGAGLLREQGFATLWKGRQKLQGGELPTTEIAEGLILAVSGALLLTPGFVTDLIGFAGLIPPIRVLVATRIMKNMLVMGAQSGGFQTGRGPSNSPPNGDGNGETIEGEAWERKDLD